MPDRSGPCTFTHLPDSMIESVGLLAVQTSSFRSAYAWLNKKGITTALVALVGVALVGLFVYVIVIAVSYSRSMEEEPEIEILSAAGADNLSHVQRLVVGGESVNTADSRGYSVLMAATGGFSDTELLAWLVEHGADIDARTEDGSSALMMAYLRNSVPHVTFLVDQGASTKIIPGTAGNGHASFRGAGDLCEVAIREGKSEMEAVLCR